MYVEYDQSIHGGIQLDVAKMQRVAILYVMRATVETQLMIATHYTTCGELTGLGNLLPFMQAAKETANFTSDRWVRSFNPAGLGANDTGAWGNVFKKPSEGIIAQYAHLINYATRMEDLTTPLREIGSLDPRAIALQSTYGFGSAKRWIDLDGLWNSPKSPKGYGKSIIDRANTALGRI